MKVKFFSLTILLLVIIFSCSHSHKSDPLLKEAFLLHEQSIKTAQEVERIMQELPDSNQYRLNIESRLANWNDNLIEVPGFDHDHSHHGHNHSHDHGHRPPIELTPEDMLMVQRELLDSVQTMRDELLLLQRDTLL